MPVRLPALHGPPWHQCRGWGWYWEGGHRAKNPKPSQPFQSSKILIESVGTSGSPKGKCNTHRNVRSLESMSRYGAPVQKLQGSASQLSSDPAHMWWLQGQQGRRAGRGRGGGQAGGGDTDKCTLPLGATRSRRPGQSPPHPIGSWLALGKVRPHLAEDGVPSPHPGCLKRPRGSQAARAHLLTGHVIQ